MLENLVKDDAFVETILTKLTVSVFLCSILPTKREREREADDWL